MGRASFIAHKYHYSSLCSLQYKGFICFWHLALSSNPILAACGRLRRSTAHFSNDGAIEANGSISHFRQLRTTWVVLLNTFREKYENPSRRKKWKFIMKELLLLVITIMDGEKRKHTLIRIEFTFVCVWLGGEWVIFLRETLIVESMYFKESEVSFKYEFKFWFGCLLSDLRQVSLSLGLRALICHSSASSLCLKKWGDQFPLEKCLTCG